ncbi:MAG: site-specific DNA-methyltransferase [Clostridia bacterium]|nr:site-specific DNA-methyltransferase [Clostridia bacterium]
MIQLRKGDCLELMKDIADGSVDCVVTDPPYKVTSSGNVPTGFINGHWRLKNGQANPQAKSGKIFKENEIKFSEWMPEIYRVLKERTHFYCMTNDLHLKTVIDEGIKAGFKQQNILVWAKGMHTPTQYYFKNIEFIVMFRKGNAKYINNIGTMALLNVKGLRNKIHPSEKPTELMKILIENSSKENEIVLDPFMGSGSTIAAAESQGYISIGVERFADYFDMSIQAIPKLTNLSVKADVQQLDLEDLLN